MAMRWVLLLLLVWSWAPAAPVRADEPAKPEEKRVKLEPEVDPYYASLGLYASLTSKPIPHLGRKSEAEIYRALLQRFYLPRDLVIEASINPLPYGAVLLKQESPGFYQSAKFNSNLNVIHAVTAGFEEPWAASLFLGNVLAFEPGNTLFYRARQDYLGKRYGYSGFLVSAGNFHIKQDVLVPDTWIETEVKLKGEEFLEKATLKWSFRFGSKLHDNPEITDVFYIGVKRDSTDYGHGPLSLLYNSGIEYVFDFSQRDFDAIRHFFLITLKMPFSTIRLAGRLGLGVVWDSPRKYSGSLASPDSSDAHKLQVILRPEIEF